MLFIGDVHATSKHNQGILACIDQSVEAFPNEKTIIFLGDYVYHFTYDRKALLQLFKKIITLAQQGKDVYILAGNHDRIQDHFVYEEAKQAFDLFGDEIHHIHFVTEPVLKNIEGIDCLLFPYYYPKGNPVSQELIPELKQSTHPKQQLSRKINNILHEEIEKRSAAKPGEKLLIIHHRYVAGKRFPGQQAVFSYANGALMPDFFEDDRLRFVSGHLHEAFGYRKYLCTGSLWHTSPLETNQQKYCFRLNTQIRQIDAHPLTYNPYFTFIEPEGIIDKVKIQARYEEVYTNMKEQLADSERSMRFDDLSPLPLQDTTLTIQSSEGSFEAMQQHLSPELSSQVRDIKYKSVIR